MGRLIRVSFTLLLFLIFASITAYGQNCTAWSYVTVGGSGYNGPTSWPGSCVTCGGLQQSPIDLNTNTASSPPSSSPMYTGLQLTPSASWSSVYFTLLNTGDVMRLLFNSLQISVTGLGLSGTYYVAQMHWHWGSTPTTGSEHTLNGQQFPMEGHLVLYSSQYASFTAATGEPNGVAVIAMWYNVTNGTDNPLFAPIINAISSIPDIQATANFTGFNLYNLLPVSTFPYFRYFGSLTTPACNQNVTWTLINNPFYLSVNQMNIIRSSMYFGPFLTSANVTMANNFRPTQQLNGRTVYYVQAQAAAQVADPPQTTTPPPESSGSKSSLFTSLCTTVSIATITIVSLLAQN